MFSQLVLVPIKSPSHDRRATITEQTLIPHVVEPFAPQAVAQVFEATCRLGLLIGKGALYGNVLLIAPPLTASEEQVAEALEMLDIAFAQVQENF